ncbi:hypothetical protein B0H14DRAFT_3430357 [Mycena olivaceomarginata]|nr:hypothetical protein B0H14DRAFT_3430357 [Mycena olivaceomarginata]
MSESFVSSTWEQFLNLPNAPVDDFNRELAGYTFETHGTGDDLEVEAFPPPDRLMSTPLASSRDSGLSHPFHDLSTTPIPLCIVLKDLNTFPPFGVDTLPFEHPPARADKFCVATDTKFSNDDEKRAFVAQNGPTKAKRPVGRPKKQKEDIPSASPANGGASTQVQYTGDDLILLTREVVNVNPFIAAYGQKGASWQQIVDNLEERGFCHKITAANVQHKAEALISYKKDPNGKNKNLAKVTQYDESKDKSDDTKAKLKAKQDADREGGEAIHHAFITSCEEDESTDVEESTVDKSAGSRAASEAPTKPVLNTVSASSLLDILNSDDEKAKAKKKSKHRRTMDHYTSSLTGTDKLTTLLKEESTRRAAHDARMAATFETFVEDACEQKKEVTSLLCDLVNIAEKEL